MIQQKAIVEFPVDKIVLANLSPSEKKVVPLLEKAAKQISGIYLKQEKGIETVHGQNFYPKDVVNNDIIESAAKNPEILSPYTIVEKKGKKLIATPYHVKYKKELSKVAKFLKKASKISQDKNFSNYLLTTSKSLTSGDYEQIDKAWLKTRSSTLQFLIGPYERNLDRRFFKKMAYLAFIGIQDPFYTKKAEEVRDILLATAGDMAGRVSSKKQIQVQSVRNVLFTGLLSRVLFATEHIPSDDKTIQKNGSRLIGYLSSMDYKFDNFLYPIFKEIFETRFKDNFSEELLRKANYYLMLVYGMSMQLGRYQGSRERLKELYPIYDEINCNVSGIYFCKHLIMKGVIEQKELEAMIIMHICWCFSEWILAKDSQIRNSYLKGDAMALTFYFKQDALKESNGISWPNFSKIFFVIENLSSIFLRIMREGTYEEAETFLKNNLSYEVFKLFEPKLSKITPLNN